MGITIKSALEYLKDFDSYSPYQEAIEKVNTYIEQFQANYETRLKADMVAMLTELQLEIEEIPLIESANSYRDERYKYLPDFRLDVYKIIQQKINALQKT